MSDVEITIKLPEALLKQARESNLLTDEVIADLLQAELDRRAARRKHLDNFLNMAEQLASAEPALTPEEIAAEIELARRDSMNNNSN